MITGKSIEELGMSIEPTATATWCYCGRDESVDDVSVTMHLALLYGFILHVWRLKKIPKGKWYCPE